MKIEIDKKKAFKSEILSIVCNNLTWLIIILILSIMKYIPLSYTPIVGIIFGLWTLWDIIREFFIIKSLEYNFEPDRLTKSYQFITKTFNQARLQVVNDVNVSQNGIFDWLFNLYNLEVNYGFGDTGYNFEYNYLSEQQAHDLQNQIKVGGASLVNIR